ncbi:hypothetical protein RI054_18g84390 [Pseudoscourfieldia marina]
MYGSTTRTTIFLARPRRLWWRRSLVLRRTCSNAQAHRPSASHVRFLTTGVRVPDSRRARLGASREVRARPRSACTLFAERYF